MHTTIENLITRLKELQTTYPDYDLYVLKGEFVCSIFWFALKNKTGENVTGFITPESITIEN